MLGFFSFKKIKIKQCLVREDFLYDLQELKKSNHVVLNWILQSVNATGSECAALPPFSVHVSRVMFRFIHHFLF